MNSLCASVLAFSLVVPPQQILVVGGRRLTAEGGPPRSAGSPPPPASSHESKSDSGIVRRIEIAGLRRLPEAAVRARLASRIGQPLDPAAVERDVRALNAMGWFDSVHVEVEHLPVLRAEAGPNLPLRDYLGRSLEAYSDVAPGGEYGGAGQANSLSHSALLRLVFVVEERPFLAGVEFTGARRLSEKEIEALLRERDLLPRPARPRDPTALWRAARAIEAALAELGHGRARVTLKLAEVPTHAVRATFVIREGPRVPVTHVTFEGNSAFNEKELRRQMQRVAPHAWFAGWRGKTTYTEDRLGEDLEYLARFYRNRGFPLVRLGEPRIELVGERYHRWLPWPQQRVQPRFHISIPIEEGTFYRVEAIRMEGPGLDALDGLPRGAGRFTTLEPYSEQKLLRARDAVRRAGAAASGFAPDVEVVPQFDAATGTVRAMLRARPVENYTLRRIEFTGHHRFSDRFYRRHLGLAEGDRYDALKLEAGLAQMARSGFIRPVGREHISLLFDQAARAVDVTIKVEEIGRQRISFSGGVGAVGVAYNLFDFFGGEEMLTGYVEGGPPAVRILVNLTKEGLFGTRASLGLSLVHQVVRPRLPGGGGSLFNSGSTGVKPSLQMPVSARDTVALRYEFARTSTRFDAGPLVPDLAPVTLRTARSTLGASWVRSGGDYQLQTDFDLAGGALGGQEDWLRTSHQAAALAPDPLSRGRNTWAARGLLAGVSRAPWSSAALPMHTRFFVGHEFVRGLRSADLAPAQTSQSGVSGSNGANLLIAANLEYRIPLDAPSDARPTRFEAAAFLDAGAGWLLPGWSGDSSAGHVARASLGMELRWTLPARVGSTALPLGGETVRVHWALSPLAQRFTGRRTALGWALGSLF
jgi:outer membrane protein assembly complex protein YaeT